MMGEDDVTNLARRLGRACRRRGVEVVTAESCTGGGIAAAITRISGSAKWFDRGFVTYGNDAKRQMLGVRARTLKRHGAVSEAVAREMARGALAHSPSAVSVAVTGIAGPTGAAPGKPVGLVWFAWAERGGPVQSRHFVFKGGRVAVRTQTVGVAIQGLIDLLR
jgi:nicotinamide-nucleotide amidase